MGNDSKARERIEAVPNDPPEERPELSAGSIPGGMVVVHETGDPSGWLAAEEAIEAPDWTPPEDRDRDGGRADG